MRNSKNIMSLMGVAAITMAASGSTLASMSMQYPNVRTVEFAPRLKQNRSGRSHWRNNIQQDTLTPRRAKNKLAHKARMKQRLAKK